MYALRTNFWQFVSKTTNYDWLRLDYGLLVKWQCAIMVRHCINQPDSHLI